MVQFRGKAWLWLAVLLLSACSLSAEEVTDPWIDAGWAVLAQGGADAQQLDAAIAVWQQGVNRLDSDRVLLSPIGVYASPLSALRGVNRLGVAMRGIVLKGRFQGLTRYFVLSVPPAQKLEAFRSHFEQLISGGQRHVYGWGASRFQRGGSMALSVGGQGMPPHSVKSSAPTAAIVVQAKVSQTQATPEQIAQKLMIMAKKARARGERKRAIVLLTELLKRTPKHARARLMSGRLMVEDGQYEAAWQVMRPLLKAESLDWKPWFWSGTAELMVGNLNAAVHQLDEALAREGRVPSVWVHRALVAQQRGRYKVAYQLLKVAETESPKSVQVMLNMGFTLDALGKKTEASNYYRRYLVQTAGVSSQWRARKVVIGRLAELH
ncbi:MAG: hypothetical protein R8J85_02725 [Mariprofundales bacterium]